MGTDEMERIAGFIALALTRQDEATLGQIRREVEDLARLYPLYPARHRAAV
jgi:glycine/serine hydroxymethyltransferase